VFSREQRRSSEAFELMSPRRRIVVRRSLSLAAILWLGCAVPTAVAQTSTAPALAVLKDLAGVSELQSVFDRDSDKTRIVLLLSPT
jgi:hypothetical protein